MDFTRHKYRELIAQLKKSGYEFITYADYCGGKLPQRFVILRHDVDLKPLNSFGVAKDEKKIGAKATYYFRAVPESWDDEVIHVICQFGHEIGYHYESLTTCNGDVQKAYGDFAKNLEKLRELAPVSTICMHGSPRSPYDSKDIWKRYDYKDLGIIGEPYLTTDFSKVLYLTDTGRRWDGYKVSVRDKIERYQEQWNAKGWSFHTTDDIIKALGENELPDQIMIATHPQRWNDFGVAWIKEFLMQNIKNLVKAILIRIRQ
ncbi:MAG: hypothetical protein IJ683_13980 [Butyrivibrio sp.]|nr:hypothetical protein [Butyrivibrio sp.]MBR1643418.1 hypothetical protein [Butyrivibrio sp.]